MHVGGVFNRWEFLLTGNQLVELGIAIILFEGGLNLQASRLRRQEKPIRLLITVGAGRFKWSVLRDVARDGLPGAHHFFITFDTRAEGAELADWLRDARPTSLAVSDRPTDLRDIWMSAFGAYSRAAYESANRIVTLYGGNQAVQQREGASPTRMTIIPNGVDVERYATVRRGARTHPPTVALMGRVVPVKDIKTFVRAAAQLRELVPRLRVQILGARDEDPTYARECDDLVAFLGLNDCLEFKGHVDSREALAQIDVLVLTSLSEAQPLVLLEAGAAGIPCVATDVGACREIILGRPEEYPALGAGGLVTPLANPRATAQAVAQLLRDELLRARCGRAIQTRVRRYYNRRMVDAAYAELYAKQIAMSVPVPVVSEALQA